MTTPAPARQPLWIYKREPAGMGEWCYRIYRNNHYMLYAESESIAMIICNGLNRDEQAPHISPPAQAAGKSLIGVHNIINHDCEQKVKAAREKVLDELWKFCLINGAEQHGDLLALPMDKMFPLKLVKKIAEMHYESLRAPQEQP